MKRHLTISSIFVCLMLLGDWIATSYRLSALAVEPPDNCVHVGRIISVQGQVQLMRKDWSNYHPTSVGTELCRGDLLLSARRATVIVQCADPSQNLWSLPESRPSGAAEGCRPPKEPIHTLTKPIIPSRDTLARQIPYISSPKKTWLLNALPTLRWQAVPGATSYTVRLSGPWVKWQTELTTTSVVYPGEPPLKSGEGYLLTVEADNGESQAVAIFGLLDENQAIRVRAAAKRIARQNLDEEAKTLATAELYIGQGLIAEAIELLEVPAAKGSKTAAVYYILGELYVQVQLFRPAAASYLKAVDLATTKKDIEGQAAAAIRLSQVEEILGNSASATYWQQQAHKAYQTLLSLIPLKPIPH